MKKDMFFINFLLKRGKKYHASLLENGYTPSPNTLGIFLSKYVLENHVPSLTNRGVNQEQKCSWRKIIKILL